jgi:hypothetical protein
MSLIKSFWRNKKSRQKNLTEVNVGVNSTTGAAVGLDKAFVKSVEKLGVGSWLITLKEGAFQDLFPTFLNLAADGVGSVVAVTKDSITVETLDLSGVADDIDFTLGLVWHYNVTVR